MPRLVFVALVSLATLLLLAWASDISVDLSPLRWQYLALGCAAFLLNYCLRTWRFAVLMREPVHGPRLWVATAAHGFVNYLIPARLGEFSFPLLAQHTNGLSAASSTAILVCARGLDIASVALLASAAILAGLLPFAGDPISALYLLVVCGIVITFLLLARTQLSRYIPKRLDPWLPRMRDFVAEIRTHLRSLTGTQIILSTAITIAIWCCIWLNFYCLAQALSCPISLLDAIAISLLLVPLSMLPAQGIANLGSYEAAWMAVITTRVQGDFQNAIDWTIGTHLLLSIQVLVMGVSAFCVWCFFRPQKTLSPNEE